VGRGWLRIYLGPAPGVGKTYAMLNEGRRRAERGSDVVVGYVEDHGRPNTQSQLGELEVVARRPVRYRDQELEEMDLPAVLARSPEIVLVDEFAHSNIPGVEHAKRWEDVESLLDAGINVITTLNLQHLESVNDVVETITGVSQRETVPDEMVRRAEQIELVDMTPEALRRRLAHGNVYPADRIDAALTNFFRPGNLAALRELALLWLADRVDDELQGYRERHGIGETWETRERVVVAVTGAASSDRLIRRAARMASRAKAELVGVTVHRDDGLRAGAGEGLAKRVALLAELGGRHLEVLGSDVASSLVAAARAENATQLVIGASQRSRLDELLSGSVVSRCVKAASGEIDVHVIGVEDDDEREPRGPTSRRAISPLPARRVIAGLLLGLLGFIITTALLLAGSTPAGLPVALSTYLLVVIAVAAVGGLIPGLLAATIAFVISNWEFTAPVHTLRISSGQDVLALVVFFVAALTVSTLVDLAARRSSEAARAQRDARALATVASRITAGDDALGEMIVDIVRIFELDGAALRRDDGEGQIDEVVVGEPAGPSSEVVLDESHVLAVYGRALAPDQVDLLRHVAMQLVSALERRRLRREAAEREALKEVDELRASLLAAVSHDLRTPLASIKAAATALLSTTATFTPAQVAELLASIDSEADRLDALVEDLLDLRRVEEGSVELALVESDLSELIAAAVADAQSAAKSGHAAVLTRGLASLDLETDPGLVTRVLFNLILNALSYGGDDIAVDLGEVDSMAVVRVIDHGPGVDRASREAVFQPFQRRGDVGDGTGVGLGLAIARGLTKVLGSELEIEDTPGGGCTMVLRLPLSSDVDERRAEAVGR